MFGSLGPDFWIRAEIRVLNSPLLLLLLQVLDVQRGVTHLNFNLRWEKNRSRCLSASRSFYKLWCLVLQCVRLLDVFAANGIFNIYVRTSVLYSNIYIYILPHRVSKSSFCHFLPVRLPFLPWRERWWKLLEARWFKSETLWANASILWSHTPNTWAKCVRGGVFWIDRYTDYDLNIFDDQ